MEWKSLIGESYSIHAHVGSKGAFPLILTRRRTFSRSLPTPTHHPIPSPPTISYRCRRPGSPAGSFIKTPWWHHCFHDSYERVNFWSHIIPGVIFILASLASLFHLIPGGHSLALFGLSTGLTHVFSALGHLYPDSHSLERLDHIGIVLTIIGTPVTALMALEHDHLPTPIIIIGLLLLGAAFLPPTPRVCGFVILGSLIAVLYGHKVMSPMLVTEIFLYLCGAAAFLRNGGHARPTGFSDHHFLHYFVTVAGCLHVKLILSML